MTSYLTFSLFPGIFYRPLSECFNFFLKFFPIFVIGTVTSQKKLLPTSVKWYPDFNLILRTMCESLPNYYICKVIIFKN